MDLISNTPKTYRKAINGPDSKKWVEAIKNEHDSLLKNKTWTLVNRPEDRKVIGCKWIFRIKLNEKGEVDRYKARLVAKGYEQIYGLDFLEVFAPVLKHVSLRIILCYAASSELEIFHLDVETAYLNGKLDEEIYMEQPEGFDQDKSKVCRLQKGLYGLKQAGRVWNLDFDKFLKGYGLTRSHNDPCLY